MPSGIYTRKASKSTRPTPVTVQAPKPKRKSETVIKNLAAIPKELPLLLATNGNGNGHHMNGRDDFQEEERQRRIRIDWSDDEKNKVVDDAFLRWKLHPEDGIDFNLICVAQKILPVHRQRNSIPSNQACANLIERVTKLANELIAQTVTAMRPQVQIEERVIKTYATPEEVLSSISLPRLIGIVESRKMEWKMECVRRKEIIAVTGKMPEREQKAERAEVLADHGLKDKKDVVNFYPKVCLVGLGSMHEDFLKTKLGRHPLSLFHRIDSNIPATRGALPMMADIFVVDANSTPDEWRKLMRQLVDGGVINPAKFISGAGIEKLRSILADRAVEWLNANPDLSALHSDLWAGR